MLAQRVEVDIIACRDDFMAGRLEVWVEQGFVLSTSGGCSGLTP